MTRTTRLAVAMLSYVILTFIIAATWHLVVFKPLYDKLAIFTRPQPIIPLGIASMLVQAGVFAFLYPRCAVDGRPARDGLLFGLATGLLIGSYAVLADGAKLQVSSLSTWLVLEGAYYLFQFPIVGLVFGLIYGVPSKAGTAPLEAERRGMMRSP
ncbi:MAG: DUF1761 domain-containing protein [Gemmatimonadetes bacterium]|nr:DUF1761 domain-containing protein [Gemmatimonadota bacterium]